MKRRVIGMDAGGTKLLAGVVDEDGAVLWSTSRSWPGEATRQDVLLRFEAAIQEAREHSGDVVAVGAAIPANVDMSSGTAVSSRHLPLAGFAFRDWLAETVGLPAVLDNDATAAMLAEHRLGAARGAQDAVMLTIGTGIGGGILSGGRIVRGAHGSAGEPGHMSIDPDGPPCPGNCPGRGCLEAYVSGPVIAELGGKPTGADVVAAAHAGDTAAREVLERVGEKLGVGIANLLNLLDPEVVVVGGGAGAHAGRLLLDAAERVARERALEPAASSARIEAAALGAESAMIGAALLALNGGDV